MNVVQEHIMSDVERIQRKMLGIDEAINTIGINPFLKDIANVLNMSLEKGYSMYEAELGIKSLLDKYIDKDKYGDNYKEVTAFFLDNRERKSPEREWGDDNIFVEEVLSGIGITYMCITSDLKSGRSQDEIDELLKPCTIFKLGFTEQELEDMSDEQLTLVTDECDDFHLRWWSQYRANKEDLI